MSADLTELLAAHPLPQADGGKESKGDLVIVGGAPSCPGSPMLAGLAALRCGAGRVQLVVHPSLTTAVGVAFPEALVLGWAPSDAMPDVVRRRIARAAAVVVGPGLDDDAPAAAVAASHAIDGAVLVVDARAMPALVDPDLAPCSRLAAPNPQEACRLVGHDAEDPDLALLVAQVAKVTEGPAAVRGETTVVDDGDGRQWVERSGSSGLGTPGSGDTLIGALGAFLARGADPLASLGWAVAVHARAGELLSADVAVGFLAREIAEAMPAALGALEDP